MSASCLVSALTGKDLRKWMTSNSIWNVTLMFTCKCVLVDVFASNRSQMRWIANFNFMCTARIHFHCYAILETHADITCECNARVYNSFDGCKYNCHCCRSESFHTCLHVIWASLALFVWVFTLIFQRNTFWLVVFTPWCVLFRVKVSTNLRKLWTVSKLLY